MADERQDDHPEELGRGTGRQGRWARDDEEARAAKQVGDPHVLDVEDDPRGGVQSEEYRHADPRDLVSEGDVTMSGPGGAPQEDLSIEERREASRELREASMHNPPLEASRGDEPDDG
jgi:hypothetical protein